MRLTDQQQQNILFWAFKLSTSISAKDDLSLMVCMLIVMPLTSQKAVHSKNSLIKYAIGAIWPNACACTEACQNKDNL